MKLREKYSYIFVRKSQPMKLITYIVILFLPFLATAQQKSVVHSDYPQDYFRNPLDISIFLAGNFGECRPGHFHSGIDIKTLGKENEPVHAAADGYISRIKMEKGGFGHGLYITHPNGYTTLYAHLNDFVPALQKYLKKEQYEKKHWDVDIQLSPDQFPVKKGEQIAWSGNTGASTAPHLHFEIRNTKTEHPLNPELFGLPVIDNVAPVPAELAVYDLTKSIYEQTPITVPLKKVQGKYTVTKESDDDYNFINGTLFTSMPVIGIGLNVDDFMNGSDNTIAFLTAKLYMDDSLQSEVRLDNIGYDETRYINAYADYKTKELKHKWIQCLFKLPGNHLDSIYRFLNSQRGGINRPEGSDMAVTDASKAGDATDQEKKLVHQIKILITDDKNNESVVLVNVKSVMRTPRPYLHPDNQLFKAGQQNNFNDPNVSFSLDSKQLYDDIFFAFAKAPDAEAYSDRYQLHHSYVPIHHSFELQMKPNKTIPFNLRSKVVMMYTDDKDEDGRAAAFGENGWYKAKVRNFGTYWLDVDTTAPVIHAMQRNGADLARAKQIAIEAKDDATSVKSFSGYIDGKWVCFEQHSNTFFYKFDEHCPKGKHKLVFKAEDENGNEAVYKLDFTR